ncbi:MAG: phosphatase PAP2 family protein [Oscillospiraceae bacterium]|nr:phosphatase PAP2 family protein [Oscillospiraceae bacterium]
MELLYFFEKIRIPGLDEFMLAITTLGEETAFLVIALILFWCIDKYVGYYTLSVGFIGTIANQFLKLWFRIPRPWVLDENFTILEQAREGAGGYSFPSGHTQSAVGTFGSIAATTKNKKICIAAIVIAALVAVSRMYIGVHTPLDVGVSVVLAVILIFAVRPLVFKHRRIGMPILLVAMILMAIGYLCFVELYQFPAEVLKTENYQHGLENAYTLLGALAGLVIVYIVDEKWLHFSVKAVWWAQILKVVIGLGLVLAVKVGMKGMLNGIFGELLGRSVRYGLIVIVAGILWPLSFRWFAKLGKKE